jgi:hypothetical protein
MTLKWGRVELISSRRKMARGGEKNNHAMNS